LCFTQDDQRLDDLRRRHLKEAADFFDGVLAGRGHFMKQLAWGRAGLSWWQGFGLFNVGCVIAVAAEGDSIFTAGSQHVKLMGEGATDRSSIRQHRAEGQSDAAEDIAVSTMHDLVGFLQGFLSQMERISIFHDEFPRPHYTEARADFIAEFGLNLIKVRWQLLVAVQLVANQIGDHFFVSRTEANRKSTRLNSSHVKISYAVFCLKKKTNHER